jgi:hypothetical protein
MLLNVVQLLSLSLPLLKNFQSPFQEAIRARQRGELVPPPPYMTQHSCGALFTWLRNKGSGIHVKTLFLP